MIDSVIMNDNEIKILLDLINGNGKNLGRNLKLIYRASRDGWKVINFESKCINKSKTIIIIHSDKNNIFGAYRSVPWKTVNNINGYTWYADNNAFLFLVKSSKNYQPAIFNVKQSDDCAVWDYATNQGVLFGFGGGWGHDICVYENCNTKNKSFVGKSSYNTPSKYYLNGDRKYFKVYSLRGSLLSVF